MTTNIAELVQTVDKMVSFPEIHMRINQMLDDPDCDMAKLGGVISYDPGLTAQILRMANSPFYGLSKEVNTVAHALSVIGLTQLRYMLLATSAVKTFEGIPNELVSMEDFWFHSLYCALAAKILAGKVKGVQAESAFVSGLLHDIGQLVLFNQFPELARDALLNSIEAPDEPDTYISEREIIGFDHAALGGALAEHWHWPAMLIETIQYHHEPEKSQNYPKETAIVHVANCLAVLAELHTTNIDETDAPQIEPYVWNLLKLDEGIIPSVLESMYIQFDETCAMFGFK
ncbi:MAG: HDOD domain-containing protein [Gammaproteobacteria bacterium]|nr:HDOD domain-containing protein [Gammaproteobacteria bacterium]